jgi:BirA family transcriptional regulator, biotin operon repressor / biotin---[acetyl-CoA-carboxylase] ligase
MEPMVFAMWGGTWDVRRFEEIDSTNAYLRDQARLGAPEGTVAVAEHQSAGRGRMDRRWEAPPGSSLLASVLFRPDFDPADLHLLTAAVALAAAEACRQVARVGPVLKWPNDLMVDEAKLAGVLAEADFSGTGAGAGAGSFAVVVGIGLNVDWPGPEGVGGTCLRDLSGGPVDHALLLEAFLVALSTRRGMLDGEEGRRQVAAELRERCATLGRRVRVELADEAVVGLAEGLTDAGHLVVRTPEGLRTVSAGDVVHLRPG